MSKFQQGILNGCYVKKAQVKHVLVARRHFFHWERWLGETLLEPSSQPRIKICEIPHQIFGPSHWTCPTCQMIFVNTGSVVRVKICNSAMNKQGPSHYFHLHARAPPTAVPGYVDKRFERLDIKNNCYLPTDQLLWLCMCASVCINVFMLFNPSSS